MIGITHNQFLKLFSDIAIAHRDINSFYSGDLDNYTANQSETLNPVTLWVVIDDDVINGKTDKPKYNFIVLDWVNQDSSNLDEVYSDTLRISKDILALLRQPYYESFFKVQEETTFTPFNEKFDSDVAGWQFSLTFDQPFIYDACEVNTTGLPTINYETIAINSSTYAWGGITGILSNQEDLQNALNAKVPTSRILTINGTSYDLSADRSWTISTGGETLAQTLALGNTSGSNHLLMNDDYYVGLGTGATNRGVLYRDSANTRIKLGHLTSGDFLAFGDTTGFLLSSANGAIYSDGVGNAIGLNWNQSSNQFQAFNLNGGWSLGTTELQLFHDTKLNFDSPVYTFNQLTASTVPYLDASKNLVSSTVTPTQLGYLDATSSIQTQLNTKQSTLVSGTNIKTVGGISLLGAGDIGSISTTYTDAKIKGSIANTQVAYGSAADTISGSSLFTWSGTILKLGSTAFTSSLSGGIVQIEGTNVYYSAQSTNVLGSSGFRFGQNNSIYGTLQSQGTSVSGNWTGTSVARTSATELIAGGTSGANNMILAATNIYGFIGTTATNFGYKLDSSGFRVDQIQNLHTANAAGVTFGSVGTNGINFQGLIGTTTSSAMYMNQSSPSSSNYTLFATAAGQTVLNGTDINFRISNNNRLTLGTLGHFADVGQGVAGTSQLRFSVSNKSNETAGTNVPKMLFTIGTLSWATGSLAAADFVQWTQPSVLFTAASTATLAATFAINGAPIASTNASITTSVGLLVKAGSSVAAGTTTAYGAYFNAPSGATNNYAIGVNGVANFLGNVRLTQTVTTEALTSDTSVTIVINGTTYKLLAKA